jgi:hypothetical protein
VIRSRKFLAILVLCGPVAFAGWGAARLGILGSDLKRTATQIEDRGMITRFPSDAVA